MQNIKKFDAINQWMAKIDPHNNTFSNALGAT